MATCPKCGSEYAVAEPTRTGYCPQCDQQLELPHAHEAQPRPPLKLFMASAPVTTAIIAANAILLGVMVATGVSAFSPQTQDLWKWGADFGPLTIGSQWWRVLTSVFVHVGLWHLAVNMWALWNLGMLAERIYGRWLYLYIYLFCGVCGSLDSLAWHPWITSAGASGAIFGLAGALIVTFRWGKLPIPPEIIRPILRTLVIFTIINIGFGVAVQFVDNAAHLGGFGGGMVAAAIVIQPMFRGRQNQGRRILAGFVLIGMLALGAMGIERKNGWVVHVERGQEALKDHRVDAAITEWKQAAAARPNDAMVHTLLGRAYLEANQNEQAVAEFSAATRLDPNSETAWWGLALGYHGVGRESDAESAMQRAQQLKGSQPK
jgi:membrane associated rhomboid family serine protease